MDEEEDPTSTSPYNQALSDADNPDPNHPGPSTLFCYCEPQHEAVKKQACVCVIFLLFFSCCLSVIFAHFSCLGQQRQRKQGKVVLDVRGQQGRGRLRFLLLGRRHAKAEGRIQQKAHRIRQTLS